MSKDPSKVLEHFILHLCLQELVEEAPTNKPERDPKLQKEPEPEAGRLQWIPCPSLPISPLALKLSS